MITQNFDVTPKEIHIMEEGKYYMPVGTFTVLVSGTYRISTGEIQAMVGDKFEVKEREFMKRKKLCK